MRVLFVGCVESSFIELKLLLENGRNIVGIVTKESSAFNSDFVDLKPLADKYGIACRYVENINDVESVAFIKQCCPDVIYCFGWSQLIKKEVLLIPPMGVIGTHPAELPYNRGRHPIIWALALGLERTASTFFIMDESADTGDIISQRVIEIDYLDDARTLYDKVTKAECEQIMEFTAALESGSCMRRKQELAEGNVWRKRSEDDGMIDWRMSGRAIYNLVRALSHPYVGAQFLYKDKVYKIWRVEEIQDDRYKNIEPGKIVKAASETDYYVKAYDELIHVMEGDKLPAKEGEYLR